MKTDKFHVSSRLAVLFLSVLHVCQSKPSFVHRVPNTPQSWPAIGHIHPNDGHGELSSFGKDFAHYHNHWSIEVCQLDSDGDGRTNGEELGDLTCEWSVGRPSPVVNYAITNPGSPDAFSPDDQALFEQQRSQTTARPTLATTASPTFLTPAPSIWPIHNEVNLVPIEPWVIAHVICGILSIGLLLPIAVSMTSICRSRVGGEWKQLHVRISSVAAILLGVCFIIPLIGQDLDDIDWTSVHPIFGVIMFLFGVMQTATGLIVYCLNIRRRIAKAHSLIAKTIFFPVVAVMLTTGYDLLIANQLSGAADVQVIVRAVGSLHVLFIIIFWLVHEFAAWKRRTRFTFKSLVYTSLMQPDQQPSVNHDPEANNGRSTSNSQEAVVVEMAPVEHPLPTVLGNNNYSELVTNDEMPASIEIIASKPSSQSQQKDSTMQHLDSDVEQGLLLQ